MGNVLHFKFGSVSLTMNYYAENLFVNEHIRTCNCKGTSKHTLEVASKLFAFCNNGVKRLDDESFAPTYDIRTYDI